VRSIFVLTVALAGARFAAAAPGDSLAEPVPYGQEAAAGPLRIVVLEVVTGQAAIDLVVGAGSGNSGPRQGLTYVAVRLAVANDGEHPVLLDGNDFALTGATGVVRRFLGVVPPDPKLDGTVEPGATREGWVVLFAPVDETDLLMLYDSLSLHGRWADRVFALEDGAAVAGPDGPPGARDDVATEPAAAIEIGETFTTDLWQIELLEIATCLEVFELSDFRVQALGSGDAIDEAPWVALRLRVTNVQTSGDPAFLSPTAFMLVNAEGSTINDVITLTPPAPDASGYYAPGASREGWVSIEVPENYVATGLSLVRFLTDRTAGDPRYLSYAEEMPVC
jgi:hypothetical protein